MAYFHGVIFAVREAETLTAYLHFQTRTQSLLTSVGERERRLDSIEARRVTWEAVSPRAPPISSPFPPDSLIATGQSLVLTRLRPTCDIVAGIAWDTVPIEEQKSPATEIISVFTAVMPAKLTRVQLRRHAGRKD